MADDLFPDLPPVFSPRMQYLRQYNLTLMTVAEARKQKYRAFPTPKNEKPPKAYVCFMGTLGEFRQLMKNMKSEGQKLHVEDFHADTEEEAINQASRRHKLPSFDNWRVLNEGRLNRRA